MGLAWYFPKYVPCAFDEIYSAPPPSHSARGELRQRWRCNETGATEWRPLPAVYEGKAE